MQIGKRCIACDSRIRIAIHHRKNNKYGATILVEQVQTGNVIKLDLTEPYCMTRLMLYAVPIWCSSTRAAHKDQPRLQYPSK